MIVYQIHIWSNDQNNEYLVMDWNDLTIEQFKEIAHKIAFALQGGPLQNPGQLTGGTPTSVAEWNKNKRI